MASILFLGGLVPAIGMIFGGEPEGEEVPTRDTGSELRGGKGNNKGFGQKATVFEGTKVSLFVKETTLIGGGVVKLGEGKSARKLPKFKLLEAPTNVVIGK
jgi:hypothetical protein